MGKKRFASVDADTSSDEDQPIKPPPAKRIADADTSSDKGQPAKSPPAKRIKYVLSRVKTERPTNRRHRRNDPNSTFDIRVGESRRLFTLNEDLFTQRSKFLRNGREQSKRWWRRNKAKMLADQDPEIFAAYVHVVCFGVDSLKKQINTDTLVDSGFLKVTKHLDPKQDKTATFLVDLYLLAADKLLDPVTANLVIDMLGDYLCDGEYLFALTAHIYASTADGSPLRMLVRDTFIHDMCMSWAEDAQAHGLPYELLQDFAVEIFRIKCRDDPQGSTERVFKEYLEDREQGYYHLKVDQHRDAREGLEAGWMEAHDELPLPTWDIDYGI